MIARTAIITGGLTGIGLASAKALQSAGHKIAVGSRSGNKTETVERVKLELGDEAWVGCLDVADQTSVTNFITEVSREFGPPSILVNSHGIFRETEITNHRDKDWFDQIDINLNGVFRMIRSVYPGMVEQNFGRIVNISSTAGHVGAAKYGAYCASKAGGIGLSKAVAVEGAPHNITCVSISPTWIDTPMMDRAIDRHAKAKDQTREEARLNLEASNPQGRVVSPEEVGKLVAFCCSEEVPALTNEDIQINAGAMW